MVSFSPRVDASLIVTPATGTRAVRRVRVALHMLNEWGIALPTRVDITTVAAGTLVGSISPSGVGTSTAWFEGTLSREVSEPMRLTFFHGGETTMLTEIELR